MSNWVVIVDGFSSGAYYPDLFKKLGYRIAHIQTKVDMPLYFIRNQNLNVYDKIFLKGDISLQEFLETESVMHFIAGSDPAVEYTDMLLKKYLPERSNDHDSNVRTNKFYTHEKLNNAHIRSIRQSLVCNEDELMLFADQLGHQDLVLKPTVGTGVNHTSCFDNKLIACEFLKDNLGGNNIYGNPLEKFLVQERILGQEFIVNTVSYFSEHYVIEIWRVKRDIIGVPLLDYMVMEDVNDAEFQELISYTKQCLDALGVNFGPSHMELKLDHNGPVLIEINSRLHGGICPELFNSTIGYNHIYESVKCYHYGRQYHFESKSNNVKIMRIALRSYIEGEVYRDINENDFSFICVDFSLKSSLTGRGFIQKTFSVGSSPGTIFLAAKTFDELNENYHKIRSLEQSIYKKILIH